jgi:hypothetical protein
MTGCYSSVKVTKPLRSTPKEPFMLGNLTQSGYITVAWPYIICMFPVAPYSVCWLPYRTQVVLPELSRAPRLPNNTFQKNPNAPNFSTMLESLLPLYAYEYSSKKKRSLVCSAAP